MQKRRLVRARDHFERVERRVDPGDERLVTLDRLQQIPRRAAVVLGEVKMEIFRRVDSQTLVIERHGAGDGRILGRGDDLKLGAVLDRGREVAAEAEFPIPRVADGQNARGAADGDAEPPVALLDHAAALEDAVDAAREAVERIDLVAAAGAEGFGGLEHVRRRDGSLYVL